jgi:biopolymer transport protein ExbD
VIFNAWSILNCSYLEVAIQADILNLKGSTMFVGKRKSIDEGISTASMPDIVFMLLIFFLVTTTISSDKGVPLTLPEYSDTQDQMKLDKERILSILIANSGDIMVDEKPISSRSELKNMIRSSLDKLGKGPDGKYKKIVSIKTQSETPYADYIFVLDKVKESGATKISIAEPEE